VRHQPTSTASSVAPRRGRGDAGQVAGIEVLPFGLLVFIVGALVVTNAWAVIDAKLAVSAATREGVRAYVEAPDAATAGTAADDAARSAFAGYGRDPAALDLDAPAHDGNLPFGRCVRVTLRGTHQLPALIVPFLGTLGDGVTVSARSSEVIDPYRSGLPGEATC
jgi:hypothetical protein